MSELSKTCDKCLHWNMDHWGKAEGFKGCSLWNNFRHFGKRPQGVPECESFYEAFEAYGPKEAYEGWAGQSGMQYNNSVITKTDGSCNFWKTKQGEG